MVNDFNGESIEVTVPSDIRYLSSILSLSRELWGAWGLVDKKSKMAELALEEALNTAIVDGGLIKKISVVFRRVPLGVRTILSIPVSVEISEGKALSSLDDGAADLLGFFLMRHVVDRLTLKQRFESTEIHMFNLLEERDIPCIETAYAENPHSHVVDSPETEAYNSGPRIVALKPDWIDSAIRCAETSKTRARLHDYVFFKKRQVELMRGGVLFPLVSVSSSGRVDGYVAIERVSGRSGVAQLLPPLVRDQMAEKVLSERLSMEALKAASVRSYLGLTGKIPITNDKLLKSYDKLGFRECALLYGWGVDSLGKRENLWLLARSIKKVESPSFHVPSKYRGVIAGIYDGLGIGCTFDNSRCKDPFSGRSMLSVSMENSKKRVDITVVSYGVDILIRLKKCIEELESHDITALLVHLPMELPQTGDLAERIEEELALLFCGIYPGFPGNSELLYVRRKKALPVSDEAAFSPSGKDLLHLIREGYGR